MKRENGDPQEDEDEQDHEWAHEITKQVTWGGGLEETNQYQVWYRRYGNRMGEFDDDLIPLPPPTKTVKLQIHMLMYPYAC